MNYAKYVSETEIILPTPDDYNADGNLKDPSAWMLFLPASKPADESIFKTYAVRYSLVSDSFGSADRRIVQSWMASVWEPEGRVAKLSGNNLIFPKTTERDSKGRLISGYDKLPNSVKILDGWFLIEETESPADGKQYREIGALQEDEKLGFKIKLSWEQIETVSSETDQRIQDLRDKYILSTHALCQLAGTEIKDKLEDVEYETVVLQAMKVNAGAAMMLTQTIMYCFFQLKLEDGKDAWDRI